MRGWLFCAEISTDDGEEDGKQAKKQGESFRQALLILENQGENPIEQKET